MYTIGIVGQGFVGKSMKSGLEKYYKTNTFDLNGDCSCGSLDELVEKSFRDSSCNNVKGHLIGDYSIKKERKDTAAARDSHIKIGKVEIATNHKKNGAF